MTQTTRRALGLGILAIAAVASAPAVASQVSPATDVRQMMKQVRDAIDDAIRVHLFEIDTQTTRDSITQTVRSLLLEQREIVVHEVNCNAPNELGDVLVNVVVRPVNADQCYLVSNWTNPESEDALVIYRLGDTPARRVFYVDVGNMPRESVEETIRRAIRNHRRA